MRNALPAPPAPRRRRAISSCVLAAVLCVGGPPPSQADGFSLPSPAEFLRRIFDRSAADRAKREEAGIVRLAEELTAPAWAVRLAVREARRQGVDPFLALALVQSLSRFNPGLEDPPSLGGGRGLMMVTPETAKALGESGDLLDPAVNLRVGIRHLKRLQQNLGEAGQVLAVYDSMSPVIPQEARREFTDSFALGVLLRRDRYERLAPELR